MRHGVMGFQVTDSIVQRRPWGLELAGPQLPLRGRHSSEPNLLPPAEMNADKRWGLWSTWCWPPWPWAVLKKPCEIKRKVRRTIPKLLLTPSPLPRLLSAQFHSCPGLAADPPRQPRSTLLEHSNSWSGSAQLKWNCLQFAGWHT